MFCCCSGCCSLAYLEIQQASVQMSSSFAEDAWLLLQKGGYLKEFIEVFNSFLLQINSDLLAIKAGKQAICTPLKRPICCHLRQSKERE